MSREIAFLPGVSGDFVDAFRYYETLETGLGTRFETAYYQLEAEIETGILTHRVEFEFYHRVNLRKFPYRLYYRLSGNKAVMVGLFFSKRDPEMIRQALRTRSP